MHIHWEATEYYDETIGTGLRAALATTPREHLLRLAGIYVHDYDPKGERLGVYIRDHLGIRIELYVQPHMDLITNSPHYASASEATILRGVVLQLAHTLFHEVGHHVTLTLNPRKKPSKKRAAVTETLENWAETYAAKRLEKFIASQSLLPSVGNGT
ncbi:hypothetical protein [Armatimonas sp.]|uniref:hypothetical protein n=1 Tax=Armatimonas sp. TaxID=1872638 RepID=UPI00286D5484|nr:hypothetical protein [Armatimonas sp.]